MSEETASTEERNEEPTALDLTAAQLVQDAEAGQIFRKVLKLETRLGRFLYTPAKAKEEEGSDEEGTRSKLTILDVPAYITSAPVTKSLLIRSTRVSLAAYTAEWFYSEVMTDLKLRAALESSVGELRLVKGLLNTSVSILFKWPEWTEESFMSSGLSISPTKLITHAVQTLNFLFKRDAVLLLSEKSSQQVMQDGSFQKNIARSLALLLLVSSPPEADIVTDVEMVTWMFQSNDEREILQNAVGSCLDAWMRASRSNIPANDQLNIFHLLQSYHLFPVVLQLLLSYIQVDQVQHRTFSPGMPLPTRQSFQFLLYPWPASILAFITENLELVLERLQTDNPEKVKLFDGMRSKLQKIAEVDRKVWLTTIRSPLDKSSPEKLADIVHNEDSPLSHSAATPAVMTASVAPNLAAIGGQQKAKKRNIDTGEMSVSPTPLPVESENVLVEEDTSLNILQSPLPPNPHPQSGVLITKRPLSPDDLDHFDAAGALTDLLWSDGAPWRSPFSVSIPPSKIQRIEAFAPFEEQVSENIVDMLLNVYETPSISGTPLTSLEEPLFHTPDPTVLAVSSIESTRASILAQTRLCKSDIELNCREVVRSSAYTMVSALRIRAMQNPSGYFKPSSGTTGPLLKYASKKAVPSSSSSKSVTQATDFETKPIDLSTPNGRAGLHTLIAKSIKDQVWRNTPNE